MTYFDHALAVALAIFLPVSGTISYQRLVRRAAAGQPVDRKQLYEGTIATHWLLFLALAVLWIARDRDFAALGFLWRLDAGFWFASLIVLACFVFLWRQLQQVLEADADDLETYRRQLGRLELLIPRNGCELGHFYKLSVTAGIVEETLWRGFMIWYLAQFLPSLAAVALSTLGFGIAHSYQGISNLPKITLVGALFAVLFVMTGSLWLPMVLHALVDLLQGRTAYEILRRANLNRGDATDDSAAHITVPPS